MPIHAEYTSKQSSPSWRSLVVNSNRTLPRKIGASVETSPMEPWGCWPTNRLQPGEIPPIDLPRWIKYASKRAMLRWQLHPCVKPSTVSPDLRHLENFWPVGAKKTQEASGPVSAWIEDSSCPVQQPKNLPFADHARYPKLIPSRADLPPGGYARWDRSTRTMEIEVANENRCR